jgi:hypothetical protein
VLASALRHMDRCELWIPSRRRIVPRSPRAPQASSSRSMRSLSADVKLRRCAGRMISFDARG